MGAAGVRSEIVPDTILARQPDKLKRLKTHTDRCALCPTKVVTDYFTVAVYDRRSGFSRDTKTPGSMPGGFVRLESGRYAPDRG